MPNNRPIINFEALSEQKSPKPTQKNTKKPKKQKESPTRDIRFERRKVADFLTFLFYALFFSMFALILVFNFRVKTVLKQSNGSSLDNEVVNQLVREQVQQLDQLNYEGQVFLRTLVTYSSDENVQKAREEVLKKALSENLSLNNVLFSKSRSERSVKELVHVQTKEKEKDQYALLYEVLYEEEGEEVRLGVQLPVSFKDGNFQVIHIPSLVTLDSTDTEIETVYQQKDYYTEGEKLGENEKNEVTTFFQRFMELYITDDERLSLISSVPGLGIGTLENLTIANLVKQENGTYRCQGTYTVTTSNNNQLLSFFDSTISKNKESFYIETMNEEE